MSFSISVLPALKDNYIWILEINNHIWVIDPGIAKPILNYLEERKLSLAGILLTHWHPDHQGGVCELVSKFGCPVYGSNKTLNGPSIPLNESETLDVSGYSFEIMNLPGHTLDHIGFLCIDGRLDAPISFVGDTLFGGGCGRLFEGTAEQMFDSLQKLKALDSNTLIYCGHEYTLNNLKFAINIEPNNSAIENRYEKVKVLRSKGITTLPTNMALEIATNPFLRAKTSDELGYLRLQKDNF